MNDLVEFDRPLFKKLAHNDTGMAAGHQAGVVIPTAMDRFFPQLSERSVLTPCSRRAYSGGSLRR